MLSWMLMTTAAHAAPLDAVRVTVFNESIAVPYTRLPVRRFHPGVAVSTSLASSRGRAFEWTVDAELAAYHHSAVETAITLAPSWRPTWWVHRRIGLSGLVGLGYKHAFYPQQTYVLRDGGYEEGRPLGTPGATLQIGTGVTIRPTDRLGILVQYRGSADGPFSSTLGMPAMTHTALHVGVEVLR